MSGNDDMMNCDDYKEALLADPGIEDETGHATGCASCQAHKAEVLALNAKISQALQLDVPPLSMPELPEIDTDGVIALPTRRGRSKVAWFALAASVVLAVFVGIRTTNDRPELSLAEQVLAHVDHEPKALAPTTIPVTDAHLAAAVPESLATMNHDAGLITFAESCVINGNDVPHLVIQGAYGPVTILLMPEEMIGKAHSFEGVNTKGVILPVGSGSIAIVGARDEQLEKYEESVLNSVAWGT